MIRTTIYKDCNDIYKGFQVSGHAGYGYKGTDIICSAVSALVLTTVNSIEKLTKDKFVVEQDDGLVRFKFDNVPSESSILLLDSLVLGLTGIQRDNGNKYLKISFKEV